MWRIYILKLNLIYAKIYSSFVYNQRKLEQPKGFQLVNN